MKRYHWQVIQAGTLALRPDNRLRRGLEDRPTSTLIWPENDAPSPANTVLTDPYFTNRSFREAELILSGLNLTFAQIGSFFVTHDHFDHLPRFPETQIIRPKPLETSPSGPLDGLRFIPCPGHANDLRALAFAAPDDGQVWIVADAVLDEDWLRAWRYYWPNGYLEHEIVQTWRSVARIMAEADVVVPGHGAPIRVTKALLADLTTGFPIAEHAAGCPEVLPMLQQRWENLTATHEHQSDSQA